MNAIQDLKGRIGILGASFDPVHKGHIEIARIALEDAKLDKVLFIPARQNPLKRHAAFASASHRLAMLEIALKQDPRFLLSDIELTNDKEISYTIDTICALKAQSQSPLTLFLIIGGDNLASLHKWKDIHELFAKIEDFIIVNRVGFDNSQFDSLKAHFTEAELKRLKAAFVDIPLINVSSSQIRKDLVSSNDVSAYLEQDVLDYIQEHQLYKE